MKKSISIESLNKAFDHRVRLGIMTILLSQEWAEFTHLKDTLDLTDGNLASHIKSLEDMNYIEVRKRFIGKKPNSSYRVTSTGRKAFLNHLTALQDLIKNTDI